MTNKLKEKRKLDLIVLSDIHLGTYGCHAKELLNYLNSIKPKKEKFFCVMLIEICDTLKLVQ